MVGIDPAFEVLKLASMRGVPSFLGVGEKLPFQDESFGGILIILTLYFVDDPMKVLLESQRVLCESGGLILCAIPKDSHWGGFYLHKKNAGNPFFEKANFYTVEETQRMLKRAGFRIEKIRSTLFQRPGEKSVVEEPRDAYEKKAGFVCLLSRKNRSLYSQPDDW